MIVGKTSINYFLFEDFRLKKPKNPVLARRTEQSKYKTTKAKTVHGSCNQSSV